MKYRYDIIEHYGRGAGYTSRSTCNRHSNTGCEKCGLLFYPKCRDGYSPSGCNLCQDKNQTYSQDCNTQCIFLAGPSCQGPGMSGCSDDFKNCLGSCCVGHHRCLHTSTGSCRDGPLKDNPQYIGECADS